MMIEFDGVGFAFEGRDDQALTDVDLTIEEGEFVLVAGRSGCGKSTLLKLINGVVPHHEQGTLEGTVTVGGVAPGDVRLQEMSAEVGSVFQHPRSQLFTLNTTDELLFGCSNHRVPAPVMLERLAETVELFAIEELTDRSILGLSGGEAQKIACASAHMLRPSIVVLDEPSASLDAAAIDDLAQVLATLKRAGCTIVVAEHRLHYLMGLCDRVVYLDDGRITGRFDRATFAALGDEERAAMGLRTLEAPTIEVPVGSAGSCRSSMVRIERLQARRKGRLVLDIDELDLPCGEVIAVTGSNGAGKTTLASSFCGLLRADASIVHERPLSARERRRRSFMVMQDVHHQLFAESVLDEVMLAHDLDDQDHLDQASEILDSLGLGSVHDVHPHCLSGGQKQRVAVASALMTGTRYLLFDEPTSGIDREHMERFGRQVQAVKHQVDLVLVITHDAEFINTCADRVIALDGGRVVGR